MEIIELKAEARSMTGKKGAKACRNNGQLPGVLYGRGSETTPLAVYPKQLDSALHTHAGANVIIKLAFEGKSEPVNVIVKDLQVDNIRGVMRHVDFHRISLDEKIRSSIRFKVVGDSPGLKEGGVLEHIMWDLEVECLPLDIPDYIEADISELEIGDSISVSQVSVPEGVEIISAPDAKIMHVVAPRVEEVVEVAEEIEGEEGEEPEVIDGAEKAEGETDEKAGDSEDKASGKKKA